MSAPELVAASAYFDKGRCSGHAQFNGRYCRDAAGPDRWCIHCAGFMLISGLTTLTRERDEARAERDDMRRAVAPPTLVFSSLTHQHFLNLIAANRADADRVETLTAALQELLAAGDYAVTCAEDIRVMLRPGKATDEARAALAQPGETP